ncbi:MAG: flagellar basal body rod protein FlgC [Robiginitomaculum sp.]|nr:MAG: flagellar basal body rod protein FlgC [Robiginitomaculum sp.]
MTDMSSALKIAAAGMRAQSARMRVIAENVANAGSTATGPDGQPYRRKVPIFTEELDRATGTRLVRMSKAMPDPSKFRSVYDPGHPAADAKGFVKYPNVNSMIEMMDMREAQRTFEANISVIENSRAMMSRTLELLRSR